MQKELFEVKKEVKAEAVKTDWKPKIALKIFKKENANAL